MPRYRPSTNAKKVSNRQMRRYAQEAINQGHRAVLVLISVLAQKGGEIVVSQAIIDKCGRELADLSYEVEPMQGSPEFVVRLLTGTENNRAPVGTAVAIPAVSPETDNTDYADDYGFDADAIRKIVDLPFGVSE